MGLMGARQASARASASAEFQSEGLSSHEPRWARLLSGDIWGHGGMGELQVRGETFEFRRRAGFGLG